MKKFLLLLCALLLILGIATGASAVYLELNHFDREAIATVPEAATMLLLGSSLFGLAGLMRKKTFKK